MSWFSGMRWDGWEAVGLLGEGLFFARLAVQWAASEKAGKPVIPVIYWHLSLAGAAILVAYALHLGSFAVLLPQLIGLVFYVRSLHLERLSRKRGERRRRLGLDRPDYPWPSLSVVVPVHNEEKTLAGTLESIIPQTYRGGAFETIAALNGCTDASRDIALRYPVRLVESASSGISFGKNLGGGAATGDLLVFVDADTRLPDGALQLLAEAAAGKKRHIGTVGGAPDRGGGVVRICFLIANLATRRRRAHAPGGVMLMDRETFRLVGGFDQSLPQGTSTDIIWRALEQGAEYVYVDTFKATTSIRRFEKKGVVSQMLDWRKNHLALKNQRRGEVEKKIYENFR